MALKLPKQSLHALAAIGWADGTFQRSEIVALLQAATKSGVLEEDMAEIQRSIKVAVKIEDFQVGNMSEWERAVTYALASWVATVDGVQSTSESDALKTLAARLGLSDAVRQRAAAAAFDIAVLPGGGKADKYDFDKLVARLQERLPHLG